MLDCTNYLTVHMPCYRIYTAPRHIPCIYCECSISIVIYSLLDTDHLALFTGIENHIQNVCIIS